MDDPCHSSLLWSQCKDMSKTMYATESYSASYMNCYYHVTCQNEGICIDTDNKNLLPSTCDFFSNTIPTGVDEPDLCDLTKVNYGRQYRNCNQWRSRMDSSYPSLGDALCRYYLPSSLDNSALHFLPNADFSNWIQTIQFQMNDDDISPFPLSLSRLCYFAGYLFAYSHYFYHYLYYSKSTQLNLTDSLSIIQQTIINLSPSYQNQDLKQLSKYLSSFLQVPQFQYQKDSDEYYLYVNVDGIIWETLMENNLSNIHNNIKILLDSLFQTQYLDITIVDTQQSIQNAVYQVLSCQTFQFSYDPLDDIPDTLSPQIPLINPFNIFPDNPFDDTHIQTTYERWLQFQSDLNNIYQQSPLNRPYTFYPVFQFKLRITQFDPILLAFCLQQSAFPLSSSMCQTFISDLQLTPSSCNQCQTFNSSFCRESLSKMCQTVLFHPNPYINTLLNQQYISSGVGSSKNECSCYNSLLPPPTEQQFGYPPSMCFTRYCTNVDRSNLGITDSQCQQYCSTVQNWIYGKNPLQHSAQPSVLDEDRFAQLCPRKDFHFNRTVFGSFFAITVLLTLRVWFRLSIRNRIRNIILSLTLFLIGTGLSIYLGFDFFVQSKCQQNHLNKSFCYTALSKIPIPPQYCPYQPCECIFDENCFVGCRCASGVCIPRENSGIERTTQSMIHLEWNISILCVAFISIYIYLWLLHRTWDWIQCRPLYAYPLYFIVFLGLICLWIITVRPSVQTFYSGTCKANTIPLYIGNYDPSQTQFSLPSSLSLPPWITEFSVWMSPPISMTSQISLTNTQIYNPNETSFPFIVKNFSLSMTPLSLSSTTPLPSYLVLPEQSGQLDDSEFYVQMNTVESTSTDLQSISFPVTYEDIPHVFVVSETDGDILQTIQLVSITTKGFQYKIMEWNFSSNQWEIVTGKMSWVAFGKSQDKKTIHMVYNQLDIYDKQYSEIYTQTPMILPMINTTDSNMIGQISIQKKSETGFSWRLWSYQKEKWILENVIPTEMRISYVIISEI